MVQLRAVPIRRHELTPTMMMVGYVVLFLMSFISFVNYVYFHPLYYWPSFDAHYYTSVADSIMGGVGFYDIRSEAPYPVTSPQHGIVFVHLLLMKLGIVGQEGRLAVIMVLNYLAFLASSYLVYKMFVLYEIRPIVTLLGVSIFVFSNHIFRIILTPINDGIFFLLAMALIYLLLREFRDQRSAHTPALILMSLVITHFRNQGTLILICAMLSLLIVGETRRAVRYGILACLSYLSIHVFYLYYVKDVRGIEQTAKEILANAFAYNLSLDGVLKPFTRTLPVLFLGFGDDRFASVIKWTAPIFLALCVGLVLSWAADVRARDTGKIFLGLYVIGSILCLYLSTFTARYILTAFPLVLLLLAIRFQGARAFRRGLTVYSLGFLAFSMFRLFYYDAIYNKNLLATKYVQSQLPHEYTLISKDAGHSYFFFNKRASGNNTGDLDGKDVLIFGDSRFIEGEIARLSDEYVIREVSSLSGAWVENRYKEEYRLMRVRIKGSRSK